MKLEYTPERQKAHNDFVHKRLRAVAVFAFVIIVSSLALQAGLYMSLRPANDVPVIIGPDGSSTIGTAVVITPEYIITATEPPAGSQLSIQGSDRLPLQHVRTESIYGVSLTLLHLPTALSLGVPVTRLLQNGEMAFARSTAGEWEGTIVESADGLLDAQPSLVLGDIAAMIAKSDNALVAISAPAPKGEIAISVKQVLSKFPELKK